MIEFNKPIIAWFSCGATSAVACKLALTMYDNVNVVYIETGSSHTDNFRFLQECEKWYGKPIEVIRSNLYQNVDDVILKTRFINSPYGAVCTLKLKKQVRYNYEKSIGQWNGQVWGFDYCKREINRAIRFKQQYPKTKPLFPLIEKMLTKEDCLAILKKSGIEIPVMYSLGYSNNNCIGCVKGGKGYWNKIRKDFPQRFIRMAEIERLIGATCLKTIQGEKLYLDELNPNDGIDNKELMPSCSLYCQIEFENLIDKQTTMIINKTMKIQDVK